MKIKKEAIRSYRKEDLNNCRLIEMEELPRRFVHVNNEVEEWIGKHNLKKQDFFKLKQLLIENKHSEFEEMASRLSLENIDKVIQFINKN